MVAHGCKPSSVAARTPWRSFLSSRRCRRPPEPAGLPRNDSKLATRSNRGPRPRRQADEGAACNCTRWGLPCLVRLRNERCALTAPFHPCRPPKRGRRSVLCGTFPDSQPEPVGVAHHRVLSCSDFPLSGRGRKAIAFPHREYTPMTWRERGQLFDQLTLDSRHGFSPRSRFREPRWPHRIRPTSHRALGGIAEPRVSGSRRQTVGAADQGLWRPR